MIAGVSAFEGTAAYYSRFRPAYPDELIRRLATFANLRRDVDRVLDLGAGTGHVAVPIARHALEVVAVEPDDGMVNELQAAIPPNVSVVQTRVEEMPDVGTFVLTTAGRSIHWFASDDLFARLEAITPRLALLGELASESDAQTTVLEIARAFRKSDSGRARDRRTYAEILSASPFSDVEQISVEVERTWTVDQLIGFAYSTSFASKIRLGDRSAAFEAAARERLKSEYRERARVDAIIGTRPQPPVATSPEHPSPPWRI
jgi:SAM-dependent methyltransferase